MARLLQCSMILVALLFLDSSKVWAEQHLIVVNEEGIPLLNDESAVGGQCDLSVLVRVPKGVSRPVVEEYSYNRDFDEDEVHHTAEVGSDGIAILRGLWQRNMRIRVRPKECEIVKVEKISGGNDRHPAR